MRRLPSSSYLRFPFRIGKEGAGASNRREHVSEQIAQVIFTVAGERVFRPEFGAGLRHLVFEPNSLPLWEITRKRLMASLVDALQGEVDPRTLDVEVDGIDADSGLAQETIRIRIGYQLAAIGEREEQTFTLGSGGRVDG
jgi:phage baseplate assembly protein W